MIDLAARSQFSHKKLQKKNTNEKREMVYDKWVNLGGGVRNGYFYIPKVSDLVYIEDEKPCYETVNQIVEESLNPPTPGEINFELTYGDPSMEYADNQDVVLCPCTIINGEPADEWMSNPDNSLDDIRTMDFPAEEVISGTFQ
jgi:hypothetical protein